MGDRRGKNETERKKKRNHLCTAVGEVAEGESMRRRDWAAATSHPPSDLWVEVMTDGEPL